MSDVKYVYWTRMLELGMPNPATTWSVGWTFSLCPLDAGAHVIIAREDASPSEV